MARAGLSGRSVCRLAAAALALSLAAGCETDAADALPVAPVADTLFRRSEWRGGPEPLSGKLRSGVAVYYRITPAHPQEGELVTVQLRLDGVTADAATLRVRPGERLRFAADVVPPAEAWRLPKGQASMVAVRLVAARHDAYLHLLTTQKDRISSHTLIVPGPEGSLPLAAPTGADYARDARGEPIVRMQAASSP